MPGALLNIKYNAQGQREKTYNFAVKQIRGGTSLQPIDTAFVNEVFGPRIPNGDFTRTEPLNTFTDQSVLESILDFLRGMHPSLVSFNSVYLSDGVTPGPNTGVYAVTPLGINGTFGYQSAPDPGQTTIAPGTNCLLLGKSPLSLGLRAGHLWLRYCVYDNALTYGGRDDVAFDSTGLKATFAANINAAISNSFLRGFFSGMSFPSGPIYFGQAQYYTKAEVAANPSLKGALKVVQQIKDMKLLDAAPRQATRGKKKTPAPSVIVNALAAKGVSLTQQQILQLNAVQQPVNTGVMPGPSAYPDEQAEEEATNDANQIPGG